MTSSYVGHSVAAFVKPVAKAYLAEGIVHDSSLPDRHMQSNKSLSILDCDPVLASCCWQNCAMIGEQGEQIRLINAQIDKSDCKG